MYSKCFISAIVLAAGISVGWVLNESFAQQTAAAVQEVAADASPEADVSENPLATLDWLVGNWAGETENGAIEFSCQFSKNNAFLIRSFRVLTESDVAMSGMQVVAWDPAQETIRSWTFDSDGGFGEDTWSQSGDRYTMRSKYTLADGGTGSALNVMTYANDDAFLWKSTNREIDGELQPDTSEITIVRVETDATDPADQDSVDQDSAEGNNQ